MDKILKLGAHLEMVPIGTKFASQEAEEKKYTSSIHEILDDETVVITNPTIRSRLVPLHKNEIYDCYIFVNGKSYACTMTVKKSVTDRHIRVVHMQLNSDIKKYERRKYYRLEVLMDLQYLLITPENSEAFREAVLNKSLMELPGFQSATTIDISGGGIKFHSSEQLPVNGMMITNLETQMGDYFKQYIFLGKILSSEKKQGVQDVYIHRMQFVDLNQGAREEFIRYIFERERENLKRT